MELVKAEFMSVCLEEFQRMYSVYYVMRKAFTQTTIMVTSGGKRTAHT